MIWFFVAGLWLAIGQIVFGALLCLTIIGIPFGIASLKMVALAVAPLGTQVVRRQAVTAPEMIAA